MITTCLQGGTANQMFQYAFGLAQAQRLGTSLRLDISSFGHDSMREYNLSLFEGVTEPTCIGPTATVVEDGMPYNQTLVDGIYNGDVLKGYWQTEKYFSELRPELLSIFKPKQKLTDKGFEVLKDILRAGDRSTFVTIRRTDYLNSDFHGVLPMEYYREAAKIVASNIKDPIFFVFSDEPEWCKGKFYVPYDFRIVGSFDQTRKGHIGREDEDLWLMSRCNNAIMANSSFSWWGAWLNPLDGIRDRVVIAPEKWFNKANEDSKDIIPARWIKI